MENVARSKRLYRQAIKFWAVMKIKLLVDIESDYHKVFYKKGDEVNTMPIYQARGEDSDNKVIAVFGHGSYLYAWKGEWEKVTDKKDEIN